MNPEDAAKKRLFGKRVSNKDMARYVASAILGSKGLPPMNLSQIQRKLGYKDPKSVRQFRQMALDLGYLEAGPDGKIRRPDRGTTLKAYLSTDAFAQHPLVKPWIESMANRKGGKPLKSMRGRITTFKKLCELLRCDPDYFLAPQDTQEILKHVARIMQGFNADLQSGAIPHREGADPHAVLYRFVGPLRDFLAFHGVAFPRGQSGVMSQKTSAHVGKYPDVQLSDEQIEKGIEYIKGKHGIDSDIYRVFCFGIQSCARQAAIMGAKIDNYEWQTTEKGTRLMIIKVFESKTEEKNHGIWEKIISWPELQKAIEARAKKSRYLVEDHARAGKQNLFEQLRQVYREIGPARMDYFMQKPFHALRHIGAHYWLRKCKYNHSIVAAIGGWHTIDELKQSYGSIPKSKIFGELGL